MAEQNNPFELEGRTGGPDRPHPAKTWTEEERAEKLSGYLEVPREFWEQIRYGTHVRYITKAGEFRVGGLVMKNPFDAPGRGGPVKRFFKFQNHFNPKLKGHINWIAAYEDLDKVYVKPDASVLVMLSTLQESVKSLNENIRKVAKFVKKLEDRLDAIEKERR